MSAPHAAGRLPASLVLVGAGKIGGAMLEGWLAAGLDPRATAILDPAPAAALAARGLRVNPDDLLAPEALVLAVKPQMFTQAASRLAPLVGPDTLVISVMAGKTIADLRARLPAARAVVRAMPNLPASIGRGATGAAGSLEVTPAQRAMAEALLGAVGIVEWLPGEDLIDAVTAVSGSGPAYAFLLAETLAAAGVAAGLPADVAARLARATVAGAGALLDASPDEPAQLRRNVTSPGGTTAAALDVLMAPDAMPDLLARAVAAAKRRAGELAG